MSTIDNFTKNTVISGTSGADSIRNYAGGVRILASGGNDTIYTSTQSSYTINSAYGYVTIYGGDGNDHISTADPNLSIDSGSGNDTISIMAAYDKITINTGTGNDSIYNESTSHGTGRIYQYAHGDGYDTIWNWSANDSISLGVYSYHSTITSGSNIIVSIPASGSITLKDAAGKTVNLTGWVRSLPSGLKLNYTKNTTVTGTSSGESINNYAGGALISAGAGNDSIFNSVLYTYAGSPVTIDAGNGDDYVYNIEANTSISGGYGNDSILLNSSSTNNNTICGGAGSDTINLNNYTSGHVIQYNANDGYDTIFGYNSRDTIVIGAFPYIVGYSDSGSDAIISIGGGYGGRMTFKNTSYTDLNIAGGIATGSTLSNNHNAASVSGTYQADYLTNSGRYVTIWAYDGNDTIVNYGYNPTVTTESLQYGRAASISAGAGADSIENSAAYSKIYGDAGNDSINNTSYGEHATLYGGADHDYIRNSAKYAYLDGVGGNDSLVNTNLGHYSTLIGGDGNDCLTSSNANYVYLSGGGGNDSIFAKSSGNGRIFFFCVV